MRIIEPTSKLESLSLLQEYFGIKYSYTKIYREFLKVNKAKLVSQLTEYAKINLSFDFSLIFYDVTTLYFESKPDENLKIPGYSKEGKHSNPQIIVGLAVDSNGFPIYYDIFKGNSFEGHTIIPVISDFKEQFQIQDLIVVADSAMLSKNNIELLEKNGFAYILGNRKHVNFAEKYESIIQEIKLKDDSTYKLQENGSYVIFHFSEKRKRKDLYEIEKAQKKAEKDIKKPANIRKSKFVKSKNTKLEINYELIEKHKFLAGIKTYKTNTNLPSKSVIEKYRNLWKVETAFRMSKSDLKARPIFHRKEEPIKAHLLLVFAAYAVSKHIEMNTGGSIKKIVKELMREIEVSFRCEETDEIITFPMTPH